VQRFVARPGLRWWWDAFREERFDHIMARFIDDQAYLRLPT
jgi:hypothetical protein